MRLQTALLLSLLSLLAATPALAEESWPTLHHDVARTGRTTDSPGVPFRYLWHKPCWDELIAPEAEPIVAQNAVYFGTLKGRLRALNADTGQELWSIDLAAPIHHAPAYDNGRIYAATLAGVVVALDARTGHEIWRFTAPHRGGFAASPAVSGNRLYLGDRAGDLHALDAATGHPVWSTRLAAPILQTVSIKNNKLAVAAEDLIPRLFDAATGQELWHGRQMAGVTVRAYYPVFWNDLVVWRTDTDAIDAYTNNILEATDEGKLWRDTRSKYKWTKQAEDIINSLPSRYTDAKYAQEQTYVHQQMIAGKHPRSFYALKIADGSEPTIYAVGYHASENGYSVPASPPVDQAGHLYVYTKSVFSEWQYPIRAFDALSTLAPDNALPALVRNIDRTQGSFPATCDESSNLTLAGQKLFNTHDHVLSYMDLKSHKIFNAYSSHAPEFWGGVYKCIASDKVEKENPGHWHVADTENSLHFSIQWNGPAQGAVAIVKDKVFWITGSTVVCLKGTVTP